jgi:hypothetical protein
LEQLALEPGWDPPVHALASGCCCPPDRAPAGLSLEHGDGLPPSAPRACISFVPQPPCQLSVTPDLLQFAQNFCRFLCD